MCKLRAYQLESSDDNCDIFINVEVGSLQFTYIKVEVLASNQDFEVLFPEVVFISRPEDFLKPLALSSEEGL